MKIQMLFIFLLLLSILFESTIFHFPFVLLFSILLFVIAPTLSNTLIIFFASFILDVISLNHFGVTMIIVLVSLAFLHFYKRYYEVRDPFFLIFFIIISCIVFSLFASYSISIIGYMVLLIGSFLLVNILKKKHAIS
jgi:hypothetical protein